MEASPFSQLEFQSDGFDLPLNPPFYPPSTSAQFPAQPTEPKPSRHHVTQTQRTLPPNQQQPPLPDVPNFETFDWNPPLYHKTQPNPQKVGLQSHRVVKAPPQAFKPSGISRHPQLEKNKVNILHACESDQPLGNATLTAVEYPTCRQIWPSLTGRSSIWKGSSNG